MKKIQTIYEYLSNYTKEQIDGVIEELPEEDKEIFNLRYGPDLNNPTETEITHEQKRKFYDSIIPRIKRKLSKLYDQPKEKNIKKEVEIEKIVEVNTEKPKEIENNAIKEINIERQQEANVEVLEEINKPEESNITINEELTKDNYNMILKLIKSSKFMDMLKVFSVKEAVIIALKLGYIDGKCFKTNSIANFLEIEEEEVRQTTKKALLMYKESINNYIDEFIDKTTNDKNLDRKYIK